MNFQKLNFAVITHVYATGPSFKLEEYLNRKAVRKLIFIGHPFSYSKDTRSFIKIFENGALKQEYKFINWHGPEMLFYVKDVLLTIWWVLRYCPEIDYAIAADNLNAFSVNILRTLGTVKHYFFYTIDYVPNRFGNKLINSVYHFMDRLAVKTSDKVWNLSAIMVRQREKSGLSKQYRKKQIVVPIGTDISVKPLAFTKVDRFKIVHMGHLLKKQGVEMFIQSMTDVIKVVPKTHVLVIGGGPLENRLRRIVKRMKLDKKIRFTGFIKNYKKVQRLLADAAVAVAPYDDDKNSYTWYTDPGKPKDYLACGIPVIITKVPQVAYEIQRRQCGFAIRYDRNELSEALIEILTNEVLRRKFRNNAIKMAKRYTWEHIFNEAFQKTE